jgi:metal-responsive CopG/Arc/MetJ family transcriptional regulator
VRKTNKNYHGVKKMRVVTFKLEEELLQQLDLYCINTKQVRSEVIREAIKSYLSMKKIKKNFVEENHKNNEVKVQEI